MEKFLNLISEVWNTGFLGIDLGSIISSLIVLLVAFLFRGFVISVILNALGKLAKSTESKIDDEILWLLVSREMQGMKGETMKATLSP